MRTYSSTISNEKFFANTRQLNNYINFEFVHKLELAQGSATGFLSELSQMIKNSKAQCGKSSGIIILG